MYDGAAVETGLLEIHICTVRLGGPQGEGGPRPPTYSKAAIGILATIWEATGSLCSQRLKAALPQWVLTFCQRPGARAIQVTRSRAYKKDDNAYIEQKNWTHVRKLLGAAARQEPFERIQSQCGGVCIGHGVIRGES